MGVCTGHRKHSMAVMIISTQGVLRRRVRLVRLAVTNTGFLLHLPITEAGVSLAHPATATV